MNKIQLSLFSNKINAICEEMGEVLRASSFSPNIKDRLDFSCAIFDPMGELCAQAAHIPVHLGSMAYAMRDVVNQINWNEGDMLVFNSPFEGGTHLPDVTLVAPLFINNELCAFITNRAHHSDIGASSAGSMPLSSSIKEEGLLISPQKIVINHSIDEQNLSSITQHMSNVDISHGDFVAQISANNVGLMRLTHLIQSLDDNSLNQLSFFNTALIELNQYAERIATNAIKEIPNGVYEFSDYLENDGFGQTMLEIKVSIQIMHQSVVVDFTGTSAQTQGNINCPISVAAAAVYYVFRCLMPENTPACAGSFRIIKIHVPDGSLLNAQYPAAVAAGNVETSTRIVDTLLGALYQALPERIPAASYGTMNNIAMGSINSTSNKSWNYYETIGGGFGASAVGDGLSATQAHMTNTLNTPIESLESHYPIQLVKYAIHKNPQHNSRHKGGNGITRCYKFLQDTQLTLLTERREIQPWGLNKASSGSYGVNRLDDIKLPSKTQLKVNAGQQLCIQTPGGGSWNPPTHNPSHNKAS